MLMNAVDALLVNTLVVTLLEVLYALAGMDMY